MKVLILNQTFHPDVVATAQYATDLAVGLVESGHEVTVVAGSRGYDDTTLRLPQLEMVWNSNFSCGIHAVRQKQEVAQDFGFWQLLVCMQRSLAQASEIRHSFDSYLPSSDLSGRSPFCASQRRELRDLGHGS